MVAKKGGGGKDSSSSSSEVGEIDTSAPFQSVKHAVNLFGEAALSADKHPLIRKPSPQSAEKVLVKQTELHLAQKELNKLREQVKNAETVRDQALSELDWAKRTVDELTRKLDAVSESRDSANKVTEAAESRIREAKPESVSVSACGSSSGDDDEYGMVCKELDAAKQELRKIRQVSNEIADTKSVALTREEEAKEVSKVYSEKIELLRKEIEAVNGSVEETKLACSQARKEQSEIFSEKEIQQRTYKAGMEESAKKLLALRKEFDPEFAKKLEAQLTETYNEIDELQKQMETVKASDVDSVNGVSLELNEAKGLLEKFVEEEKSLQESVESLKAELKNVKTERSEVEAKEGEIESVAGDLNLKLSKSKSELEECVAEETKAKAALEDMMSTLNQISSETEAARRGAEEMRNKAAKMGKKTKKAGKGKEKTERKTAKAEEKKARREGKKLSPEDDIDAILLSIQKEEAKKKEVLVEENVSAPSPRSNCSLTINPLKETELILYGGEFYNGQKTYVYGDLYRYDVDKQEWKLVSSPNSPPPRSSHQAVAWKNYLYIFGGEFTSPNQERFHHYKDFWMLDVKTNQWEQLNLKGCPSPRSGHRMVLYKHKIIVFGGFYDTLREVRYYNDLYVFDLDQYKWQEIKPKPGAMWPTARSGFQFFVYQDEIFLYGGYSKEVSSEKSSEKGVVHADLWSLDPRTWEWNKVKKIGMPPSSRAGFSVCVHKKRALLFGGVVDMEMEGDVMMSLFLNELYGFQLDNRRWYPIELRKEKSSKDKAKKNLEAKPIASNDDDDDDDDEMDSASAMGDVAGSSDGISERMAACLTVEGSTLNAESDKSKALKGRLDPQVSVSEEVVKPCGRINSCMVVGKDTLYIYGGMMEIKDKEITLDDLYSLNLSKLDEWKCIIPATETEWVEVSEDEEGDEDEDEDDSEDEGNSEESDDEDDDEEVEAMDVDGSVKVGEVVAMIKGEGKALRRKEKRARIEQIRANLGLSDSQRTPAPGETLKDFYKRTNMYWQMAAYEHTQHTGKELRKDGFDLAETRYLELKPVLDELAILEAEQKAEEAEAPESSGTSRKGGIAKKKR